MQRPYSVNTVTEFASLGAVHQVVKMMATKSKGLPRNVIILGSGRRATMAWREVRVHHGRQMNMLGFVDDRGIEDMPPDIAKRYLCGTDRLPNYILHNSVQQLIVATPL